jgi:hypothetical protein
VPLAQIVIVIVTPPARDRMMTYGIFRTIDQGWRTPNLAQLEADKRNQTVQTGAVMSDPYTKSAK